MDVLCFGEVLFDIIEGKAYPGGAPMNFAAHIAKLGARSFILSRVGSDDLGDQALQNLSAWNIETKFVQRDTTHPTGTVDVALTDGSPSYTIHEDVAFDYIDLEEFIIDYTIAEFDFLYFGTLAQRNEVSRSTLLQLMDDIEFPEIFFDINLRQEFYTREIIHVSLHHATIFKLNDEEVGVLSKILYERQMPVEELCHHLAADFNLKIIIVTKGGDGCSVFQEGKLTDVPGVQVEVKDTVGAGDSFSAAFMYFYLNTGDAVGAAKKANILGGFVASCSGAVPEYSDEIRSILKEEN